jgi:hypothetical protein
MKASESSRDMNFSEEGMQLWDKHFAPHIDKKAKVIHIPANCFNFITLMLVTPEKFDWAKQFLNSALWQILIENDSRENSIPFVVPDACTIQQAPAYQIAEMDENSDDIILPDWEKEDVVTPSAPKRKRRGKGVLVESEVRRSPRILELNDGFRNHSCCKNKNCLSCLAVPPITKNNIVKNLATSFCKVSSDNLDNKLKRQSKKGNKEKEAGDVGVKSQQGKKKKSN